MCLFPDEKVEKIYEYETFEKSVERVKVTDRRLIVERSEKSEDVWYDEIEKTQRAVCFFPSGGSLFFALFFLFALGCGITAFCFGWFDEEYYLCVAGAALVAFGAFVCLPMIFKARRKEYGLNVTVKGRVVWLDIGDKKLTELLAGELAVKTPTLKQ